MRLYSGYHVLGAIALLAAASFADEAPLREGVSLTIYNAARPNNTTLTALGYADPAKPAGWAVIKQRRLVQAPAGRGEIRLQDVAATLVPESVSFTSLTDPAGILVLDQNFLFDLASVPKLLNRYVDRPITVLETKGDQSAGTLLSVSPGAVLLKTSAAAAPVRLATYREVRLGALPSGLMTRPTLVWQVQAQKGGEQLAEISYLADALTWRADYILRLQLPKPAVAAQDPEPPGLLDLSGWATITNESGAGYSDAHLKLMGGDVQRLTDPEAGQQKTRVMDELKAAEAPPPEVFKEKAFFEYHLYTLPRPTTLPDRSSKQLELFRPASDVEFKKVYVYQGVRVDDNGYYRRAYPNRERNYGFTTSTKVDVYLEFKNAEQNHLGLPLPAGRVRVYLRTSGGDAEFIGEDEIDHTPKDEPVRVRMGSAFDLVGERRQTAFTVNDNAHLLTESIEVRLRNHKTTPVTILVREDLFRWVNHKIVKASHAYEKRNARQIQFPVAIEPAGEAVLTYTVQYDLNSEVGSQPYLDSQ